MKFLITGGFGLLGSEIYNLRNDSIIFSSKELNLLNFDDFNEFLKSKIKNENVDCVIHCAAKVGGVLANMNNQQEFLESNLKINDNVFKACKENNIKLVSILSSCIYPKEEFVTYPLTENQLHNGPPHPSNYGYAYAKRMLEIKTRAHNEKSTNKFINIIPNNLYGLNDNFNLEAGHVIPAMLHKFHLAKINNLDNVVVWGDGTPVREFTFARDMARDIVWLAENYNGSKGPVNVGCTNNYDIKYLANLIAKVSGYSGKIVFDSSKPNGQKEKPMSTVVFRSLGYNQNYTSLRDGLKETYEFFKQNYESLRIK
jgi:GDP-L-fucose synthase